MDELRGSGFNDRTGAADRAVALFFLAVLGALILLSAYQKQHWDTDIFWALKSGEWISGNLKVPTTDPFSYTFQGRPWVDFTWGFQVLAHLFFTRLGGWAGLYVLQAVITGLTFVFVFLNLRLLIPGRPLLNATLMLFVFAGSLPRFFIRPHLFEYFFISLYLLILNHHDKKGRAAYLYALLPLQAVWINVHSSAVLGVFTVGAYALGGAIDAVRSNGLRLSGFTPGVKRLVLVSILVPIASLVNPYGLKLAIFPFIHQGGVNADALRHIAEWQAPPFKELLFYFYPLPLNHFAFFVLLIAAAVSIIFNYRALKARDAIIMAVTFYMAVTHVRWTPLLVYFAAPVFAANYAAYKNGWPGTGSVFRGSLVIVSLCLSAAMLYDYAWGSLSDNRGVGVKETMYPAGTVAFMKANAIKGNMFNEYVFGGYLIYSYPEAKVFIDGRTPTVYEPYFFWKTRLADNKDKWDRLSKEYNMDIAILKLDGPLCPKLRDDPEWAAVSFDDVSVLFLKKTALFRGIIEKGSFDRLNPCSADSIYKLPADTSALGAMRQELLSVFRDPAEVRAALPHRLLGLVDSKLGDRYLDESVAEFNRALKVRKDPYVYYDLGVVQGKLGKKEYALASFRSSIAVKKDFKDGYLGAGLAYYELKDYRNAVCYLEKYLRMADDMSESPAYATLGLIYFSMSDFERSVSYLRRAAFLMGDAKDSGNVHYHLGSALFELGLYDEGVANYRLALKTDPKYLDVLKNLANRFERAGKATALKPLTALIEDSGKPGKKKR